MSKRNKQVPGTFVIAGPEYSGQPARLATLEQVLQDQVANRVVIVLAPGSTVVEGPAFAFPGRGCKAIAPDGGRHA